MIIKQKKMKKENNIKKFLNKKSFLNLRLNQEVLEDGIAYIPCYVENMEDIPEEFFYVVFWLFADSVVRSIFIERGDSGQEDRRRENCKHEGGVCRGRRSVIIFT